MTLLRRDWRRGRVEWLGPLNNGFITDGLEALYLMDVERRNLVQYSESMTTSPWGTSAVTVTPNDVTDPFGNDGGAKLEKTSSEVYRNVAQSITLQAGTWTVSCYVKQGTGIAAGPKIQDIGGSGVGDVIAHLNFSTLAIGNHNTPPDDKGYEEVGNGWYRVWAVVTVTGAGTFSVGVVADYDTSTAYNYAFGAMVNEGSTPLPYVPTTNKQALYDYSGKGRHATRGSVGSAFICPVGEKHVDLPATASNQPATNASVDLTGATGDIEMYVDFTPEGASRTEGATGVYGWSSKFFRFLYDYTNQRTYAHYFDSAGSYAGGITPGTNAHPIGTRYMWRIVKSGNTATLQRSSDGGTWSTQGTADLTGVTLGIPNGSAPLVGYRDSGLDTGTRVKGRIYRAYIKDDVATYTDFNPDRDAHGDVSRFTSSTTGEVWTINQASAADTNDPTWTGEGIDGDGTDDYTTIPYSLPTSEHTVFVVAPAESGDLVATGGIGAGDSLLQFDGNHYAKAHVWNDAGSSISVISSVRPARGTTVFAAQTVVGGGVLTVYVNGKSGGTAAAGGSYAGSGGTPTYLGYRGMTGGTYFPDTVSVLGLCSRALSDAEIAQNFEAAKALLANRGISL